ncbi:MAG: NAD(P)-dependent oxidoreductase [Deinococcales bacterium]
MPTHKLLLTGGSGRLGTELQQELQGAFEILALSSKDLDITSLTSIEETLAKHKPDLIVHTAAYTNVSGAEKEKARCWLVNVTGTRNIVKAALNYQLKLIHISTDYVFSGQEGNYQETDPIGPVSNYYSLSKLAAEELVHLLDDYLIIRTSFRPRAWPYPVAFDDVYTSQDYVDIIAPEIALAIKHHQDIPDKLLHIATERKSVYELAKRRAPEVKRSSKREANVNLPNDISLDIERWQALKQHFR